VNWRERAFSFLEGHNQFYARARKSGQPPEPKSEQEKV
jgi:hypothetical protein